MTVVLFSSLVLKLVDFVRLLANAKTQASAIVTQLSAWIAGWLVVALGANASVTEDLVLPGLDAALGTLDGASQVLVGMLVASLASVAVDAKQAIDDKDSAAKPRLLK